MDDADKVLARAIVEKGDQTRTIVSLRREQAERLLSIQSSELVDEREHEAIAELARGLPPGASDEECWNTFLARLRESGLSVREVPPHDYQLEATIDLKRPGVVSVTRAADDATRSPEGDAIARGLHDTIVTALR